VRLRRSNRTVAAGLGAAVILAIGAWIAGGQIRSPAQIAAETAAPDPSAITVPVERRVLSSEVIVRGTVRYGSPQPVVLATSEAKANRGVSGPDIVTTRPKRGSRVSEGAVAMSVSGRPVFVLRGAQPSHRDMGPGSRGPDVRQLESALTRMGFPAGRVDGRYDGQTAAAVARWYEKSGWAPFGSTDTQLDQLRTARANAAAARDAYVQARIVIDQTKHPATPGDIAQARIDLETARDTLDTAIRDRAAQSRAVSLALLNERRDNALATAELTLKQAALNKAVDTRTEAQRNLAEAPPDTSPSERAALQNAARQASDDVTVAQADLTASQASARATREAGRDAVVKARADKVRFDRAVPTARRQVVLADRRLRILRTPGDTQLQGLAAQAAGKEARGTAREVARLARKIGIQVPADEVLFFSTLPLRVDSVRVRRGDSVTGRVMTVSNSRLAIDSSLSPNDAKLVRPGATVKIEEPDLGVHATGVVSQVADRPGTHKVDPARVYLEIVPDTAPAQLVGASVKLTIAVKSTEQAVLTVPVTALSVGADGGSRLQVRRPDGRSEYVTVEPGLAAQGLVEVRPVQGRLGAGDLVVVGERGTADGADGAGGASGATSSTPASGSAGTTTLGAGGKGGGTTAGGAAGGASPGGATSKQAGPSGGGGKPSTGVTP
jgi:putative peptidoglycan binding protein